LLLAVEEQVERLDQKTDWLEAATADGKLTGRNRQRERSTHWSALTLARKGLSAAASPWPFTSEKLPRYSHSPSSRSSASPSCHSVPKAVSASRMPSCGDTRSACPIRLFEPSCSEKAAMVASPRKVRS